MPNEPSHNHVKHSHTCDISSILSCPLSKMMSLLESLSDGLSENKKKEKTICDMQTVCEEILTPG